MWWTFVIGQLHERKEDFKIVVQIRPEQILDQIFTCHGEDRVMLQYLYHSLTLFYAVEESLPTDPKVEQLPNWILRMMANEEFVTKKQMLLCLLVLAAKNRDVLFYVISE
jgi:hypothetical protein